MVGTSRTPILDTPTGDLVLRIRGGSRDGQVISLGSQKCTVGSGPYCTLRLNAFGVRPIHCMIIRGEVRTIVRRWAPDTRLNGRAFTDSDLVAGDRLSIGPIEFDVVETPSVPLVERPKNESGVAKDASHPKPPKELDSCLSLIKKRGYDRAKRLITELRAARERLKELQEGQQNWTEQKNAFDDRCRSFEQEQERWQQRCDESESQLRRRSQELDSIEKEMELQLCAFKAEQQEFESRRSETDRGASEQLDSIETQLAEIESRWRSFEQEQERWQQRCDESESQLMCRSEQLDARQREIDLKQEAIEEERRELESGRKSLDEERQQWLSERESFETQKTGAESCGDEAGFSKPVDGSPNSTAEIFNRLGLQLPSDDEEEGEERASHRREDQSVRQPLPDQEQERSGCDDEGSIDSYMNQLLNRVQNIKSDTKPGDAEFQSRESTQDPVARPHDEVTNSLPKFKSEKNREMADLSPRTVAPEKTAGLSVLRELAKVSADSAINTHSKKVLSQATRGKLIVSIVAVVTGLTLLWLWGSFDVGGLAAYSALSSFLIAVFSFIQYKRRLDSGILKQSDKFQEDSSVDASLADNGVGEKSGDCEQKEAIPTDCLHATAEGATEN